MEKEELNSKKTKVEKGAVEHELRGRKYTKLLVKDSSVCYGAWQATTGRVSPSKAVFTTGQSVRPKGRTRTDYES